MLAIGKAVNFALAICHPLVLCHEIIELTDAQKTLVVKEGM